MVFQSYALFPHMTVFNNVAFPLKMQRCPSEKILQRVNAALAMVHLEKTGQPGCRPNSAAGSSSASAWPERWFIARNCS